MDNRLVIFSNRLTVTHTYNLAFILLCMCIASNSFVYNIGSVSKRDQESPRFVTTDNNNSIRSKPTHVTNNIVINISRKKKNQPKRSQTLKPDVCRLPRQV